MSLESSIVPNEGIQREFSIPTDNNSLQSEETNPLQGYLQIYRADRLTNIYPVTFRLDALPFRQEDVMLVDPPSGIISQEERDRFKDHTEFTPHSSLEKVPILRNGVIFMRAMRTGKKGMRRWLAGEVERFYKRGQFENVSGMNDFIKRVNLNDSRIVYVDTAAAVGQGLVAWMINGTVGPVTHLMTGDFQLALQATGISLIITPAIIRNAYLFYRLPHELSILSEKHRHKLLTTEYVNKAKLFYLGLFAANLPPAIGYAVQPFISAPNNLELAKHLALDRIGRLKEKGKSAIDKIRKTTLNNPLH